VSGVDGAGIRRVTVVGGGAAGTIVASELLRSGEPVEVTVIERRSQISRGVAYSTADHAHLLNVPAGRMGAINRSEDHFLFWARQEIGAGVGWGDFLPRAEYGRYLGDVLAEAERVAAPGSRLEPIAGEVVSVRDGGSIAGRPSVTLASGERRRTDAVVLALGNFPPAQPVEVSERLLRSGRYVPDPWAYGALETARRGERVLLIGTGLTMVDVALALGPKGSTRKMTAISRGGMMPRRHRSNPRRLLHPFPLPSPLRLGPLLSTLYAEIETAPSRGQDWRDVVDSLRMVLADIWCALPDEDRLAFQRHLSRIWEVHRHRLPPASALAIERLRSERRLAIEQAGIESVSEVGRRIRVALRPPGGEVRTADFDCVVNCTGCSADLRRSQDPLLRDLFEHGTARPGPLGLGLDARPDGALLDAGGNLATGVFAIGPLLRGVLWESTAIAEVRSQATALADRLATPAHDASSGSGRESDSTASAA
jgi:uncharacterized NAD(P)/FAD-binding protein YdhS